jgi:signal transduction histidine kinase
LTRRHANSDIIATPLGRLGSFFNDIPAMRGAGLKTTDDRTGGAAFQLEFVRRVIDSLLHEVAVIDASGAVVAVNRRWEASAEKNGGGLDAVSVGANYLEVTRVAADAGDVYARRALDGLLAILNGQQKEFALEYPCDAPDCERWFLMYAARAEYSTPAIVVSHTDITERVQVESKLREATERLRESDRHKDQFLATLAHELRNPLSSICNAVYCLHHETATEQIRERQGRLVSMIGRQAAHLMRLVDDLLDVSRVARGKIELKKQHVDLIVVLRHSVDTVMPKIECGGHDLRIELPSEPVELNADPVRLAQIFTNLLNNAAKYMEPRGTIWLTAERREDEAVVTVRDIGVGIPADMLSRIFDLFTQVDQLPYEGGLGIGLALVKDLLALHGGTIEAHSEGPGKGSTFVARLPLLQSQLAQGKPC